MTRYLYIAIALFLFGAYVASFIGCAASPDRYRNGINLDRFHKVVTITTEYHIVKDRSQFDCNPCPGGTAAYAYNASDGRYIIYILGETDGSQYDFPEQFMGHEVKEALHIEDKQIRDPHGRWWIGR